MRFFAAAALFLALGCASGGSSPPAPAPVDARVAELQISLTELLERLDVMSERLARLEESGVRPAAPAVVSRPQPVPPPPSPIVAAASQPAAQQPQPQPQPAPPSQALRSADLAEQYRLAIVHYGARRVADARAGFQRVFDADPSGDLADNALFWIGETYFSAGDFANAIGYYRRVSQQYGDQNKAPDAVYKLGMSYARTGDLALARQTFQDVIARYPYSTPAASAKAELERIKY